MRRAGKAVVSVMTMVALLGGETACGGPASRLSGSMAGSRVEPLSGAAADTAESVAANRSVVVAAVGDISPPRMGDQRATARLTRSWNPKAVLVLGDLQYPSGGLADMRRYYNPTWGTLKARTKPVPGNHEYRQRHARGYTAYFGKRAMPQGHTYYSYNINGWHVVALNSEIRASKRPGQLKWLRADLRKNRRRCVMAYWHRPRFSSGREHGSDKEMAPFWNALYKVRADVVLSGHEHNYERFARQAPDAKKTTRGIRQFVVGTGGVGRYSFAKPVKNSQVRHKKYYGVLKLSLAPTRYYWNFVSVDGRIRDRGTTSCH